ncbi:thioredoxin family protein [Halococcus saccharolyticus]|uniref:Alkyl hydroperoxide reductase/ Thiol specific antioxidant/ Mal allergen n=1 Tax=Halococcus saccharolyticus DSM 5350 TaxID=1227455 RepID=M0MMU8_9EURY|nr:thioredoxin family protein [Halococcus saccharolyticus]EMA46997.1 alkyl hydroperoxide reductase/ Thiol specific antioxidant/ Mal allergen [Halococcus saccharolyticus DSM 5350]
MTLEESARELERGDLAPGFELPDTDGDTRSIDDFADNKALLVTFTCNHCPYAQAKFDTLNRLADDYGNVAVVGINPNDADEYPDDSFERMQALVDEGTIEYDAYLRDESQDVARAYGAVCTPDPFLFKSTDDGFELAYHGRLDDAHGPDEQPSGEPGFEMAGAIESVLAGVPVDHEFRPSRGCSIKWH